MVPKRIPGQLRNQAMVLMRIPAVVGEDEVWRDRPLQFFKDRFDIGSNKRHKTVGEGLQDRPLQAQRINELSCRVSRLRRANSDCAEHDPMEHTAGVFHP